MNNVNLIGRFAQDGELKYSATGVAYYQNTLAVNRNTKEAGADFIYIVAFKKTAEMMGNSFKKGDQIGIEGRIQTSSYEKDGQKTLNTQVIVKSITFLGKKKTNDSLSNTSLTNEPFQNGTHIDDSDLPF